MMTLKTKIFALSLLALAGLAGCSSESKSGPAKVETVRGVAMTTLAPSTVPDTFESVGTVHAAEMAQVSSQMMGNVLAVNVREGDRVRRGQVLVVIDDAQPRAGLERAQAAVSGADHEAAAAEAEYTLADATMKRYESLFAKKSVSPQEMDEVKARFQGANARREMARSGQAQAKAALAQAQTQMDYTRVRAAFDGVVTERRVDPGALAAPGMPLLTVEGSGSFRLEANVDESDLRYVRMGQQVPVLINAVRDTPMEGKVVEIVPAADPGSRSFVVKVQLPANPAIRSGLFGRARFSRGERQSLLVPKQAVVTRGQLQGVYVVGQGGIASLQYVTVGRESGDQLEVLSGLSQGEKLVTSPGNLELAGKRIEVR